MSGDRAQPIDREQQPQNDEQPNNSSSMRRLILIILTALAALLPPSLLLSITPTGVVCSALPHPSLAAGTTRSLSIAAMSLPHFISSMQLGGGLSSPSGGYGHEFHAPGEEEAMNVNSLPGGVGNGLDTFKVAVLGASKGVDGGCGYSMVEFQNNHPSEDIIIYSAHIEPSVIFPLEVADSIAPNPLQSSPPPLFPETTTQQQQDRELHIQPGSTVTLPVSILPHYKRYDGPKIARPKILRDYPHNSFKELKQSIDAKREVLSDFTSNTRKPPREVIQEQLWRNISYSSAANLIKDEYSINLDLYNMIETVEETMQHPPSHDIKHVVPHGEIHETLIANTSWGFLRMKVPYACSVDSKEYEYGLPNNLVFMDGGGGWYARRNVTRYTENNPKTIDQNPFVYDLHMDNPSSRTLNVLNMFVTRPDLIALNDRTCVEAENPFNTWVGAMISPGKTNAYVTTIGLVPTAFNYTDLSLGADLGFLVLRTTHGTFSIGLDLVPNRHRWGVIHGIEKHHSTVGNVELIKSFKLNKLAHFLIDARHTLSRYMGTSISSLYRKPDTDYKLITHQFMKQLTQHKRVTYLDHKMFTDHGPALLVQPNEINFGIITTGSRSMRLPVNLANVDHDLLSIMRISVTIRMTTDEGVVPFTVDPHVLEVGLEFMGGPMILLNQNTSLHEFPHHMLIPAGSSYNYPINIWCKFLVSPDHAVTPRKYSGSVIFRAHPGSDPSYIDWMQQALLDDPLSSRYVTSIPFQVSVIPGNFRISTDSLLFPTHYSMLPPGERSTTTRLNKKEAPESVDRFLEVTNNFIVPITISSIEISNSREYDHCNSVFSIAPTDSSEDDWKTAESNKTWRIPIRFTYSGHLDSIRFSKKCILTLETDRVGKQSLPLIIHNGKLVVEVQNGERGIKNNECAVTNTNGTLSRADGLRCLRHWVQTKNEGQVFSAFLKERGKAPWKSSSCREISNAKTPEEDYLASLLSNGNPHRMEPVMLKFGAVSSGSVVKRSIFFTNMNPASVEVTVSSSVFEDMNVTIGHKPISIPDALERVPRQSHMKFFLTHSTLAQTFLSKLKYKVDISLSPRATMGELSSLYEGQAVDHTFGGSEEYQTRELYKTKKEEMHCSSGFVISTDGSYQKSFSSRGISTKKWKIPPGGVARFVVTLQTPHRRELKSDMSSFIATGLALETNYGEAFPIILSYNVLLGHLQLVPSLTAQWNNMTSQEKPVREPEMEIPMSISDAPSDSQHGIPISIESTFSKEIFVGEIKSCNRWFDFTRRPMDSSGGSLPFYLPVQAMNRSLTNFPTLVSIGRVHSTMSCSGSFFSCALKWLENRDAIQPNGCGLTDQETFTARSDGDQNESEKSIKQLKSEATNALIEAVGYFKRHQPGGYIMPSDLIIIQKAREAWSAISSHGLNVVSGHLSAFSAYHDSELNDVGRGPETETNTPESNILANIMNNRSDLFPLPVSSILLKSTLDPPHLFYGKRESIEFETVHVAQTSARYIHVSNPSGVSVIVQLSAAASASDLESDLFIGRKEFMQTKQTDRHSWWTGESYWMAGNDGKIIGAPHNVTFKSGSGSSVNLVQPSLQSISPFIHGCGTRCGRRSDVENSGNDILFSTIGAGSGSESTLLGHPWHIPGKLPQPAEMFNIIDPQPFSVGYSGLQEVVLPPYGRAKLGPVYFRPTKRGEFNSSVFISNNLTGFEEVKLRGRGIWEKLVFLDNDESSNGGDIEFRNGRSALIFSGSTSSNNDPVVKSFVLANLGDVAVNISGVSMKSSEIKHFSHRSAHPTDSNQPNGIWSLFNPTKVERGSNKCYNGRYRLVGCEDNNASKSLIKVHLSSWFSLIKNLFRSTEASDAEYASHANSTSFQEEFTLYPNENRTFFVEHKPDCVLRTSYVSVVFEIDGRETVIAGSDEWHKTFRSDKLELLVGYSMNPYVYCIPYVPPAPKLAEKVFSFAISSNMLLGFIRRKEDQGSRYVHYEVEVSYAAALCLAILVLLAFDIYTSFEFAPDDDRQDSIWKQTCRCLARADPVSEDLVALGREQTKHVLLSRFRKEKVMPTNCVLPDGSFCRDKPGGEAGTNSAPYKRVSSSNQQAKTFSDAVFHRHNLMINETKSEDNDQSHVASGILPRGIAWRTAVRRGISATRSASTSAESQHLARTRSALAKKKHLQQKRCMDTAAITAEKAPHTGAVGAPVSLQISTTGTNGVKESGIDSAKPPQDQQEAYTQVPDNEKMARKDPTSKPPAKAKGLPEIESKSNHRAIANIATPVQKADGSKETTHVTTKPSEHVVQNLKRTDSFKGEKQAKNDQSRSDKMTATKHIEAKPVNPKQPSKREDTTSKPPANGKDKNPTFHSAKLGSFHPSAPIVVKQPGKGQKFKVHSKKEGNSSVEKEKKKSKNANAPPLRRSTSEESIPSSTPISSAQPSPHSEASIITPKLAVRTPPGLLPPPGFTGSAPPGFAEPPLYNEHTSPTQQAGEDTPTLLSSRPSFSELSPTKTPDILSELQASTSPSFRLHHDSIPSPSLAGLLSPRIEDEGPELSPNKEFVNSSMLITDLLPPPPRLTPPLLEATQSDVVDSVDDADVQGLLGSGYNSFNVTNFLDGIMNDEPKPKQPEDPTHSARAATKHVSLDPWNSISQASPQNNPLSAIIGRISDVEATALRSQDDQHEIAGIPLTSNTPSLLTPSTLHGNISSLEPIYASLATEVHEGDDEDFLEPDSFYSQLLGE